MFDLLTGCVVIWQTLTMIPMPDQVMKIVNDWGKYLHGEDDGSKLQALNKQDCIQI